MASLRPISLPRLLANRANAAASAAAPKVPAARTFGLQRRVGALLVGGDSRLYAFPARGVHMSTFAARKTQTEEGRTGAATREKTAMPHELAFLPERDVQQPLAEVHKSQKENGSTARVSSFSPEAEDAINQQINIELTISHVYESMYAFFQRDNVALPGLAAYFEEQHQDERKHARKLISYLNRRGGRVHLLTIPEPVQEFAHEEKGDALHAMELSLALEKLNYDKLSHLDKVASDLEDFNLADFVDDMLEEQSKDVKQAADYVAQLTRVGKGHGVWDWDARLFDSLNEEEEVA